MAKADQGSDIFRYRIDLDPLLAFAKQFDALSATELSKVSVEALNTVTEGLYDIGRERMIKNINLDDSYVKSKMEVKKATVGDPTSQIVAAGQDTVLGRFDAKPVTAPTRTPAAKLKGNAKLGIPAGRKQAGVSLQVLRGQTNVGFVPRGYLLPLRAGKAAGGNGFGVFARDRAGVAQHRYGPSPYQLFRYQIPSLSDEAGEAFALEAADRVEDLIKKAFA